jgi:hypothetical protein
MSAMDGQGRFCIQENVTDEPVRLSLLAKSASHLVVFFSYNKLVNSIFIYDLSAKRT